MIYQVQYENGGYGMGGGRSGFYVLHRYLRSMFSGDCSCTEVYYAHV